MVSQRGVLFSIVPKSIYIKSKAGLGGASNKYLGVNDFLSEWGRGPRHMMRLRVMLCTRVYVCMYVGREVVGPLLASDLCTASGVVALERG